jgi:hypothetical protein
MSEEVRGSAFIDAICMGPALACEDSEPLPDGFVDSEPSEDDVNDSLGTVNTADTMDTDPEDENEGESKSKTERGEDFFLMSNSGQIHD